MNRTITLSSLLFAAFLTTPALAEEQSDRAALAGRINVSATIPYQDLDLATPSGVAAFEARVASAVTELCRRHYAPSDRRPGRVDPRCFADAMAGARIRIGQVVAAQTRSALAARGDPPASR